MTYVIAAIIFALAVLAMAVGVLFGKARIRGSCGAQAGMRDKDGNVLCDACRNPSPDCRGDPDVRPLDRQSENAECAADVEHAERG